MAEEKTAEIILLRDYKRKKEEAEHKAAYDAAIAEIESEVRRLHLQLKAFTDDWVNGRIDIIRSEFRMSDASVKRAKMHIVKDEEK